MRWMVVSLLAGSAFAGQAVAETRRFDIPAQPLPAALSAYAQVTGARLAYLPALAAGRRSPGATGALDERAALDRLLAGTGLLARQADGGAVTLQPAPPPAVRTGLDPDMIELPPVDITGTRGVPATQIMGAPPPYAGGQVATGGRVGLLGNQSVFDTPFSTSNYSRELIDNQRATAINDVLLNDPAVRSTTNRFGDTETRTIRGFNADGTNTSFLGIPGMVSGRRPRLEGIERVELLEGPNTLLNGAVGSDNIGGAVNLVPKRASDTPTRDFGLSYTSRSMFEGTADLGQRFGPDKAFGARVNLSARAGATPIDHQRETGSTGTAAIDYRSDKLRVSLDLSRQAIYMKAQNVSFQVAPGLSVPKPPDGTKNILGDNDTFRSISSLGVLHAEYDVADWLSVFATYGLARTRDVYNSGFTSIIIDMLGNTTTPNFSFVDTFTTEASQFGAQATFDTAFVFHRATFATDRFDQLLAYNVGDAGSFDSNIYNPVPRPLFANPTFDWNPSRSTESKRVSYAVADTMSVLNERVQLTAGGRQQYIDERTFDTDGATSTRYRANRLSPAVALVVKPLPQLSVYGNYIEQLNAGDTAPPTAANAGQLFPPYVSEQKEVGLKYDFGRLAVTAALFQITRPIATTSAATQVFSVGGEQRNRGLELKTFGEVYPGVRLLGGVAFIEGVQTKTADGTNNGKKAVGVPVTNVSFGAEWDTPYVPRLTLTSRVIYTGKTYLDEANTQRVPAYATLDIGARYTVDRGPGRIPIVVRGGISNVTGENYWQTATTGSIQSSVPRTFFLSTSFSL